MKTERILKIINLFFVILEEAEGRNLGCDGPGKHLDQLQEKNNSYFSYLDPEMHSIQIFKA